MHIPYTFGRYKIVSQILVITPYDLLSLQPCPGVFCLIDKEKDLTLLFDVPTNLVEPVLINFLHRELIHIVGDKNDGISVFVIALYDRSKAFLPCRVPQLQLDEISLDVEGSYFRGEYLNLKSTPIVGRRFSSNESSAYLRRRAVLPTPEGPTKTTLKTKS